MYLLQRRYLQDVRGRWKRQASECGLFYADNKMDTKQRESLPFLDIRLVKGSTLN